MVNASIVIPSFRGASRLPRLLDALSRQSDDDWEGIVVIDGVVDGSEAVVAKYSNLPLRTVVFPENRGQVAALNAGLATARGSVLIRCDDDLEPGPDYIAHHVRDHADAAGEVGVVGLCENRLVDNRYAAVYGDDADARHRDWAHSLTPDRRWQLWAANCSLRRETWEAVGPYDARYRAYGWEDADYGYRLSQRGIPIILDPLLQVTHHAAATTTHARVRRAFLSGEARRLFDEIHGPGASGPPRPITESIWDRTVRGLGSHLSQRHAEALAKAIDATLPALPVSVGRKAIALMVESAGVAGYEHQRPDSSS